MRLKSLGVGLLVAVVFLGLVAPIQANDQSMDETARLLTLPLAECVGGPTAVDQNRFKIESAAGRWHMRNSYFSKDLSVFGASFGYARFFSPAWGLNFHTDAAYILGHNAEEQLRGYGVEGGVDAIFSLGAAPSAAGPLNGSSLFIGYAGWLSKLQGDYYQGLILPPPNPKDTAVVDSLTYQLRIGWQGRLWMKRAGPGVLYLEPAFYFYMNNAHRSIQLQNSGTDDDTNPTSYGAAITLHMGMSDVILPGDRLGVGVSGALGFDHNNSYQFNIAYSFGAFNPAAGE